MRHVAVMLYKENLGVQYNLKPCSCKSVKMSANFLLFLLCQPKMTREAKKLVFSVFKAQSREEDGDERRGLIEGQEERNRMTMRCQRGGRLKMVTKGVICVCAHLCEAAEQTAQGYLPSSQKDRTSKHAAASL